MRRRDLLLRAGQERIRHRDGEDRHEIPPFHPQLLDPTLGMDYGSAEPLSQRLYLPGGQRRVQPPEVDVAGAHRDALA